MRSPLVRSISLSGVTTLRRVCLAVLELVFSLLILATTIQEVVGSLASSYVSIYLFLFFKPRARVSFLRGSLYSLQGRFLSFHFFLIVAFTLSDAFLEMRFNSVNKPSFALLLNFAGVKVNKDASGYAFRVGKVLNLIPAFARASVRSFYTFVLCECSDESPVFTFQKHS